MSIDIDHAAMNDVIAALRGNGTTLDKTGSSMPGTPNAGAANSLLADVLFTFGDTSTRLVAESTHIGDLADQCNVDYQTTDSHNAEQLLETGKSN